MLIDNVYNLWNNFINDPKFSKYFTKRKQFTNQHFKLNINNLKDFIDKNHRRPNSRSKKMKKDI